MTPPDANLPAVSKDNSSHSSKANFRLWKVCQSVMSLKGTEKFPRLSRVRSGSVIADKIGAPVG